MDEGRRRLLISGSLVGGLILAPSLVATCSMRKGASNMVDNTPPRRPDGAPKPLLEEDIAPTLARLDAWYATHLSPDRYVFNPPATDAQLDAFERLVGLRLPESYRQLYRWHDGDAHDRWGHIYGLPLLPLQEAGSQWKTWNEVLAGFDGNRYEISGGAWPEGAVDPAYINPGWIPLTNDGSGNHIGLDFDPWPGGRMGQVILFGRDEDVKAVLAPSLGGFLAWIADLLDSGNFRLEADTGQELLRPFRLKTPPSDFFHDGVRTLLGAPGPFL